MRPRFCHPIPARRRAKGKSPKRGLHRHLARLLADELRNGGRRFALIKGRLVLTQGRGLSSAALSPDPGPCQHLRPNLPIGADGTVTIRSPVLGEL
jgi:hypothetical protein